MVSSQKVRPEVASVSLPAFTLIPALGRQRQVELCKFEASLVPELQDSQGCRETVSIKKKKKRQNPQTQIKAKQSLTSQPRNSLGQVSGEAGPGKDRMAEQGKDLGLSPNKA